MKKLVAVMGTMMLLSGLLFADSALAGRVKKRQVRQKKRIHQGVRSGELTRGETKALKKEQRRIQKAKRRARSDGKVTKKERARLEHMQDRSSRHIYRAKHNERDRSGRPQANRVDRREHHQKKRIHQGVKSGELTYGETKRLTKEQRRIHKAERRAKSDGMVTANERARLEHMQDRSSKHIYRAKHNEKTQ